SEERGRPIPLGFDPSLRLGDNPLKRLGFCWLRKSHGLCFKKGTVTILEDESDNRDEGTTLLVGAPLLASEVSEVDNSLYIPSWSQEVFCQLSSFKKSKSTDRDLHSTVLQLKSSHHTDTGSSKAFELLSDRIYNGAVN
ncbi:unnamed protein product, partial [Prunus brigantina]